MNIFPAIDLVDKKAVRLYKGDYTQMTVYSKDPVAVAKTMEAEGARFLHLVDLEGARDGGTPNIEVVRRIAAETALFTEIGGGVRDRETIERYLDAGVDRVILGTAAVRDEALLQKALAAWGEKIAVGADLRDGVIAVRGWLEKTDWTLEAFVEHMQALGVGTLIITDISRDGAMHGTNRALYRDVSRKYSVNITASGGVSSLEDIRALRDMGLYGAIVGKAYYTGAIRLREALEAAR
ncbi:MAG: 1-(5-phosphoribosyl)-5-[Oscillospiraceae bacterium]|nr:1-(5-phosphoribosyl)-5-[(5-phosphoribosylamino)methylideneamino]imidazole-4-carboxamide isomerase [Oscillospiraceae bacterium]